jgi:hypothetical protein
VIIIFDEKQGQRGKDPSAFFMAEAGNYHYF